MLDFILRQIVHLCEPIGFVWIALLALTIQLCRVRRFGLAVWTAVLFTILTLAGCTGLPGVLLGSLERPYAGIAIDRLPKADAVVLLGGGAEPSRYETEGMHLTPAGDRLNLALHLMRLQKAPVLVIGGGSANLDGRRIAESNLVAAWFNEMAATGTIPSSVKIIPLAPCANTHDEAVRTKALAEQNGWRTILLVTSANHMRRATGLFRAAQVDAIPAPCNFLTNVSTSPEPPAVGLPSVWGFDRIATWLHEEMGWWECKRRGWIK